MYLPPDQTVSSCSRSSFLVPLNTHLGLLLRRLQGTLIHWTLVSCSPHLIIAAECRQSNYINCKKSHLSLLNNLYRESVYPTDKNKPITINTARTQGFLPFWKVFESSFQKFLRFFWVVPSLLQIQCYHWNKNCIF